MKKKYLALMCFVSLTMMTACSGDKKAGENGEEQNAQTEQVAEDNNDSQAADNEAAATDADPAEAKLLDLNAMYANGDFKPGATVIFADDFSADPAGEFPAKWNLTNGSAEVKELGGRKVLELGNSDAEITPKVNGDSKTYLPDAYTLEYEYYCNGDAHYAFYTMLFREAEDAYDSEVRLDTQNNMDWNLTKKDDERLGGNYGELDKVQNRNAWNHFAMSYDKGTVKLFINGKRVANVPNIKPASYFVLIGGSAEDGRHLIANVRICK